MANLIPVVSALLGVFVGALMTYVIQERRLRHADSTRFHVRRLEAYANFTAASQLATSWWQRYPDFEKVNERNRSEIVGAVGAFLNAEETVRLIATKTVNQTSNEVHRIFGEMQELWNAQRPIPQDLRQEFNNRISLFVTAARKELNVSDI